VFPLTIRAWLLSNPTWECKENIVRAVMQDTAQNNDADAFPESP
jgi:hypothetical protein